ncbi:scarecrow-like protein 30 [Malania oleifera]|uniref:scarecrow-like protein 30 n=1 Tax=Malania oleifera TaxID=397392 RepID=UPI0025AE0ED2|nr:scarecrow-like protein 30 [Malania oleifera]
MLERNKLVPFTFPNDLTKNRDGLFEVTIGGGEIVKVLDGSVPSNSANEEFALGRVLIGDGSDGVENSAAFALRTLAWKYRSKNMSLNLSHVIGTRIRLCSSIRSAALHQRFASPDLNSSSDGSESIEEVPEGCPVNYGVVNGAADEEPIDELRNLNAARPLAPTISVSLSELLCSPFPHHRLLLVKSHQRELCEDVDFSDAVLKYISQMLMEEDTEEKICMFQESALQSAEKSFYEVLGEKYPPSPKHHRPPFLDQNIESQDEIQTGNYSECNDCGWNVINNLEDPWWDCKSNGYVPCYSESTPVDWTSQSSFSMTNSGAKILDGFFDCPGSRHGLLDCESKSIMQFRREIDEASKFLPKDNNLCANFSSSQFTLPNEPEEEANAVVVEVEKHGDQYSFDGSRGRKHPLREDGDLEMEGSTKLSAVCTESTVRTEMLDMMLLSIREKGMAALRVALQDRLLKNMLPNGRLKGSNGRKGQKMKRGAETVDLKTLLILCAEAVTINDRKRANELLKHIREHSSATGDGMQRLATYFANGLEARLTGSGSQIYAIFFARKPTTAEILKAYYLLLAVCPFWKLNNFFSSKNILHAAEKATRLHIIDFGISYGFQWPSFIEQLSARVGGPPKLRITGIDLPPPGFKAAEMIEETGRRLANYAESFNVPFEFNAIAKKLEMVQMDDIKIDRDEVLVVNWKFPCKCLLDETVMFESPRDMVLNLIRKMNPDVFIHAVLNANHGAPFFLTRFREALFHYSALFDMCESTMPREIPERMLLERDLFGLEAMNVIACEGFERIARPETYKQWQIRNIRAGFRQLPLNEESIRVAKDFVTSGYHKDFVFDVDAQWLLQGWKGRILSALSAWKPLQ